MKTSFLKDCIADAYIQLLFKQEPVQITALQIAQAAGVGRATYFRNFSSKEEILIYKLKREWEEFSKISIKNENVNQNMTEFYAFNYKHRELIKRIYEIKQETILQKTFFEILNEYPSYNPFDRYLTRFVSYGLFGILEEWVSRDFKESVEELSSFVENNII